jgi:hypothetical protein
MDERQKEAKIRVEGLRASVAAAMAQVAEARDRAKGTFPRRDSLYQAYSDRKKALASVQAQLREAKDELVKLSGTQGGDPKWDLIREAWHVLSALDEAGIDIGERGHALIDDIEFHVPHSRLHETRT